MTPNEMDRIAAATNALRPDWPILSIRTLLAKKLRDRPRRDVAIALTWVACDSESKTPARVLEAGPWWTAGNADASATTHLPPKPHEACRICGRHVGRCLCDEPSTRPPDRSPIAADHIRTLRAIVRAATTEEPR